MTSLSNLRIAPGSKTEKFRKGQGRGTGNGKTAGKGTKGQGAHNHTKKNGFEGGQLPLARRLPKFGFKNVSRKEYAIVKLGDLDKFEEGATVTTTDLIEKGMVKKELCGVKILSGGQLTKKLTVKVAAYSASAKKAIEDLGGEAVVTKE